MLLRRVAVGLRWRAISWPLAEEEVEAGAEGGAGGDTDCGGVLCLGWLGWFLEGEGGSCTVAGAPGLLSGLQMTPRSSAWVQSLIPQPLERHSAMESSVPVQRTLSNQIKPNSEKGLKFKI